MFKKNKYRLKLTKLILPYASGVKRFFWLLAALSGFSMIIGILTPQLYKLFVDKIIIGGQLSLLPFVVGGYTGLFLIDTAFAYITNYAGNRLTNRVMIKVKLRLLNGFFAVPLSEAGRQNAGDMQMRIDDDANRLADFPQSQMINYTIANITMVVTGIFLFTIEWRLALFSIAVIPITFLLDHFLSKKEEHLNEYNRENEQNLRSWMQNSIAGWKEIKALNLQKKQVRTFTVYLHNFARYYSRWIYYWTARVMVIPSIKDNFLMQFGIYFVGGLLIINGSLTIGSLLVFMLYYKMMSDNLTAVSRTDADLQSNKPYYERVIDALKSKSDSKRLNLLPVTETGEIKLENLTFNYPDTDVSIFKEFTLKINRGERVAITGASGAGKTTLINVIMGILRPQSGNVTYSGIDVNSIDPRYLYGKIGYVMQENLLFNLSIRENLLLANPRSSEEELDKACKNAYIFEFIDSLPDKYETIIGERGIKLSGGQRQRLVLARLFLRDVDVLIFDEATSSLDQYSEMIIQRAIDEFGRRPDSEGFDKTLIVIAHRESSTAICGRKITL